VYNANKYVPLERNGIFHCLRAPVLNYRSGKWHFGAVANLFALLFLWLTLRRSSAGRAADYTEVLFFMVYG